MSELYGMTYNLFLLYLPPVTQWNFRNSQAIDSSVLENDFSLDWNSDLGLTSFHEHGQLCKLL